MKFKVFILFCFLSFATTLGITAAYLFLGDSSGQSVDLIVGRGSSINSVTKKLNEHRIISYPTFFKAFLRITQGSKRVRAGEFRFKENMRPVDALRVLYFADPVTHKVTFPEGWNIKAISAKLSEMGLINEQRFHKLTSHPAAAKKYNLAAPSLEGFLFPDTYYFSKLDTEERIIDQMVERFFRTYRRYEKEAKEKKFTVEKLVTFASIVEKETGVAKERPIISSVFHNRIKKGMRLQSDPTTIYGIKNFDGNLTKKHLQTKTPYNTYKIKGLPIGPIASPGEAALVATLRPATTDYLYFVSKNNGTHTFSKTYREHVNRVNYWQRGAGRRNRSKNRKTSSNK